MKVILLPGTASEKSVLRLQLLHAGLAVFEHIPESFDRVSGETFLLTPNLFSPLEAICSEHIHRA